MTDVFYLSTHHDDPAPLVSRAHFNSLIALPRELFQSVLRSIASFEQWTYSLVPERADATITDEEIMLHTQSALPLNLTRVNQYVLGLSSESDWLTLVLSRHPYCLCRRRHDGVASAVTQALRRANSNIKTTQWESRNSKSALRIRKSSNAAGTPNSEMTESNNLEVNGCAFRQILNSSSMARHQACVQSEEEACKEENLEAPQISALRDTDNSLPPATALVVYDPAPILKLTRLDLVEPSCQFEPPKATPHLVALLAAIIVNLTQYHLAFLERLEDLECNTPILSIEPCESKDLATPNISPRFDRTRSLSGSTVAEIQPREQVLSISTVSTMYTSENATKRVQWDERDNELVSPKRPKLNHYKQVSSGRVATLMDRFENFHL
jgi:hypothetical protein